MIRGERDCAMTPRAYAETSRVICSRRVPTGAPFRELVWNLRIGSRRGRGLKVESNEMGSRTHEVRSVARACQERTREMVRIGLLRRRSGPSLSRERGTYRFSKKKRKPLRMVCALWEEWCWDLSGRGLLKKKSKKSTGVVRVVSREETRGARARRLERGGSAHVSL